MPQSSKSLEQEALAESVDIPGTQLRVSRVALGTWAMGGSKWGGTDERESVATIRAALDQGINLIDTAPAYGFGSPKRSSAGPSGFAACAQRQSSRPRWAWNGATERFTATRSRERIMREIDESLRRLRTDYIDIYHVHWPDPAGADRRNRRSDAHALRAGKDPRHRRQQFLGRADGTLPPGCASARAAAAVQPLRAGHRNGDSALLPRQQHRDVRLRRAVSRAAQRPDAGFHALRRR